MRNLLAFMMALVLTVGGLGWYLEWFKLRTTAGKDGNTTLNIDVNSAKVYTDVAKGADKVKELAEKKAAEAEAAKKAEAQGQPVKSNGWFD